MTPLHRIQVRVRIKKVSLHIPDTFHYSLNDFQLQSNSTTLLTTFNSLILTDNTTTILSLLPKKPFLCTIQYEPHPSVILKLNSPKIIISPLNVNLLYSYWGQIINFFNKLSPPSNQFSFTLVMDHLTFSLQPSFTSQTLTLSSTVKYQYIQQPYEHSVTFNSLTITSPYRRVLKPTNLSFILTTTNISTVINELHIALSVLEVLFLLKFARGLNADLRHVFFGSPLPTSVHSVLPVTQCSITSAPLRLKPNLLSWKKKIKVEIKDIDVLLNGEVPRSKILINNFTFYAKKNQLYITGLTQLNTFNADTEVFETLIEMFKFQFAWVEMDAALNMSSIHLNVTQHALLAITGLLTDLSNLTLPNDDITKVIKSPTGDTMTSCVTPLGITLRNNTGVELIIQSTNVHLQNNEEFQFPSSQTYVIVSLSLYSPVRISLCGIRAIFPLRFKGTDKIVGDLVVSRIDTRHYSISSLLSVHNKTSAELTLFLSTEKKKNIGKYVLKQNEIYHFQPIFSRVPFAFSITTNKIPPSVPPLYTGHLSNDKGEYPHNSEETRTVVDGSQPLKLFRIQSVIKETHVEQIHIHDNVYEKHLREIQFVIDSPILFISKLPFSIELSLLDGNNKQYQTILLPPFNSHSFLHNPSLLKCRARIMNDVIKGYTIDPILPGLQSSPFWLNPSKLRPDTIDFITPLHLHNLNLTSTKDDFTTHYIFTIPYFFQNFTLLPLTLLTNPLSTNSDLFALTLSSNSFFLSLPNSPPTHLPNSLSATGTLTMIDSTSPTPIDIVYTKTLSPFSTTTKLLISSYYITLRSRYVIHNNTIHKLSFTSSQHSYEIHIHPNNFLPCSVYHPFDPILHVYFNQIRYTSLPLSLKSPFHEQIILRSHTSSILLTATLTLTDGSSVLSLDGVSSSFCRVENLTQSPLAFRQKGTSAVFTVDSNTAVPFGWSSPNKKKLIEFLGTIPSIIDPLITTNIHKVYVSNDVNDVVILKDRLSTVIKVMRKMPSINLSGLKEFTCFLSFEAFKISAFLGNKVVFSGGIGKSTIKYVETVLHAFMEFSVECIEVINGLKNNQLESNEYQMVVCKNSKTNGNHLHIGAQLLRPSSIMDITSSLHIIALSITISPTELHISPLLLSTFITTLKEYYNILPFSKSPSQDILSTPPSLSFHLSLEQFIINPLNISINLHQSKNPKDDSFATLLHHLMQLHNIQTLPLQLQPFILKTISLTPQQLFTLYKQHFLSSFNLPSLWNQWASSLFGLNFKNSTTKSSKQSIIITIPQHLK